MAFEGMFYNYNAKNAYPNTYIEDEQSFYDLHQASLSVLDMQTENYDFTCLQEDYFGSTTTFLHQPPQDIVTNDGIVTPTCDMDKNKVKRRSTRGKKNKEDLSNQRMTHIAVERNRRKLMNDYLSVLRSLMPQSYVHRCDQASIVGGAINYIRELEQRLHFPNINGEPNENSSAVSENMVNTLADIDVSLVESHASLKIRSRRRPKLLVNMVSGLQSLGFIILHLNVSTVSDLVLYCISTKMEDYCKLSSVADIATAVHEMLQMYYDGV